MEVSEIGGYLGQGFEAVEASEIGGYLEQGSYPWSIHQ